MCVCVCVSSCYHEYAALVADIAAATAIGTAVNRDSACHCVCVCVCVIYHYAHTPSTPSCPRSNAARER